HGGRGSVSVMDVRKMLRPEFDDTDRAVERNYDSGYFGAVGLLVLPELLLVSHSENWLTEDGSNRISIIDRKTGGRRGQIEMALGHPGHACPASPVPSAPPAPPPLVPCEAPGRRFGCCPTPGAEAARVRVGTDDPNGQARPFTLAWTPDGRQIIVANYRTNNVSIVDLRKALAHEPGAEVARIPVTRPADADGQIRPGRPKGTAVTLDGRYAVVSGGPRLAPDPPPSGTVWVI